MHCKNSAPYAQWPEVILQHSHWPLFTLWRPDATCYWSMLYESKEEIILNKRFISDFMYINISARVCNVPTGHMQMKMWQTEWAARVTLRADLTHSSTKTCLFLTLPTWGVLISALFSVRDLSLCVFICDIITGGFVFDVLTALWEEMRLHLNFAIKS